VAEFCAITACVANWAGGMAQGRGSACAVSVLCGAHGAVVRRTLPWELPRVVAVVAFTSRLETAGMASPRVPTVLASPRAVTFLLSCRAARSFTVVAVVEVVDGVAVAEAGWLSLRLVAPQGTRPCVVAVTRARTGNAAFKS
jgi:hypothetical protein